MKKYLLFLIFLRNLNFFQSQPLLPTADNWGSESNESGIQHVHHHKHHHNYYHHHHYDYNCNHNYPQHNFQHDYDYRGKVNQMKSTDDNIKNINRNDSVNDNQAINNTDADITLRTVLDAPKNCKRVDFKGRCL